MLAQVVPILALLAAPAANGTTPALPPTPELPSYGGLLVRTLIALVVVLLLAWVLLRWGMRRFSPGVAGAPSLRVLAKTPLDGRRSVVLVEASGRYLVLGVAEGGVSLLCELEAEAVSQALSEAEVSRPRRFAEVLRERLGRGESNRASRNDPEAASASEPKTPFTSEPRTAATRELEPLGRDEPKAGFQGKLKGSAGERGDEPRTRNDGQDR